MVSEYGLLLRVKKTAYITMTFDDCDYFNITGQISEEDDIVSVSDTAKTFREFGSCTPQFSRKFSDAYTLRTQLLREINGNLATS